MAGDVDLLQRHQIASKVRFASRATSRERIG